MRHWLELRELGIASVERETYESALRSARAALEAMGVQPFEARQMADRFLRTNLKLLEAMVSDFRDEQRLVARAKSGRDELEKMLTDDRARRDAEHSGGWR